MVKKLDMDKRLCMVTTKLTRFVTVLFCSGFHNQSIYMNYEKMQYFESIITLFSPCQYLDFFRQLQ